MLALKVKESCQQSFSFVRRKALAAKLCDELVLARDVFTPWRTWRYTSCNSLSARSMPQCYNSFLALFLPWKRIVAARPVS